jgi:S1-C subfamily serine protease
VAGSITALNQTITAGDGGSETSERLHGMLQTNADIVPGDSGGPLSSTAGKVIGMNTAAATGSLGGSQQSVGFAIPINRALSIARTIIAGQGSATIKIGTTGFLGVLVPNDKASTTASPARQRQLEMQSEESGSGAGVPPAATSCIANDQNAGVPASVAPVSSGALILGELCGTPAATAGISAGDVITAVGGKTVTTPSSLTTIMQDYPAGASASISWVDTTGQKHTSSLVLAQAPPQ